eukprot:16441270-Heterocapsa_arctica.AAC.1
MDLTSSCCRITEQCPGMDVTDMKVRLTRGGETFRTRQTNPSKFEEQCSGMDLTGLGRRGQLEHNISLQKWSPTTPDAGKGPEWNRKVLVQSGKVPADRMKEIEI